MAKEQKQTTLDLSGTWQFALDRDDVGIVEQWWRGDLPDRLELPGSLQAQGFGDDVTAETDWVGSVFDTDWFVQDRYAPYREPGNVKVPFWLQPEKRYIGAAWYRRTFTVPEEWQESALELELERPHWGTQVWVDGRQVGQEQSLSTPHTHTLGVLGAGKHTLAIRVDNRMLYHVGPNAHSVSDHTQTAWNGIVGKIEVTARAPLSILDMTVTPKVAERMFQVTFFVAREKAGARPLPARLLVRAQRTNSSAQDAELAPVELIKQVQLSRDMDVLEVDVPLGENAHFWDEFHPALYKVTAAVEIETRQGVVRAEADRITGLREISTAGQHMFVNGRRIYLRGTLECCIFPRTGYPPTDLESWRRILRICKAHGLNHMRFHSWCPPDVAFQAGDELGVYFQVECAAWVNLGAGFGKGDEVEDWLYEEAARITKQYGHHPCFVMLVHGNEPGGDFIPYLTDWVLHWKQKDPAHLHTSGSGWPEIAPNDYHLLPDARIQQWGAQLASRINALPPETTTNYDARVAQSLAPLVSHEVGQWCVYPNFGEIAKYDGYLKARNFEIFQDFLAAHDMADQAHDFLMASGKLQVLCYKEEIEALLRTRDLAGFQLLDLHDFPGQGTALVGVLDPFWDEKPYVSAQEFRRFCGEIVPLAEMPKRYWRTGESFAARIKVAQYGAHDLQAMQVTWRIDDAAGGTVAQGALPAQTIAAGGLQSVGEIVAPLQGLPTPGKYTLFVTLAEASVENDWDFWLFADDLATLTPADILITERLDDTAIARLRTGGKVLLTLPPAEVRTESQIGFSSAFWNTSWTKAQGESTLWPQGQAPHTLGILCNPAHPLFAHFPTEYHSNWQWWELIHGAAAMVLDKLPAEARPLVQPIDTWFEARRLGLLLEAQVEGGRLMVCSMDISSALSERLVARQMRHAVLAYMASEAFSPQHIVTVEEVQGLVRG